MTRLLILAALLAATLTPKPPELCEPIPVMDSYQCPGTDVNYVFTLKVGCDKPVLAFHNCAVVDTEDPANFAPPPDVDPEFDEHGPGPGEGPPGAGTVDRPDLPEPAPEPAPEPSPESAP